MKKFIAGIAIVILLGGLVVYARVLRKKDIEGGEVAAGRERGPTPVEVVKVEMGDVTKKVVATGAINARAEVEVYPKQTGELVELLVDAGDKVEAGQTLGRIESELFGIQKKQAQADLASAKAAYDKSSPLAPVRAETDFKQAKSDLDRLQSVLEQAKLDLELQEKQAVVQVRKAQADLRIAEARLQAAVSGARDQELEQAKVRTDNAKRDLERLKSLLEDEMISQDQVDSAQLQYDIYSAQLSLLKEGLRPEDIDVLKAQVETAKASLDSAENNMALIGIKRSSLDAARAQLDSAQARFDEASAIKDASTWEKDIAQAEAAVKKAEAALETAQKYLDDSAIKAPIGGIIAVRSLDKGDTASPGKAFVTIVDMDVVEILAKVPAQDCVDIKVGDRATIKPDVYPGKAFPGTVVNISPVIDRETQTSEVKIEASNPGYKLKPGMFTSVEMTTVEHKGVPLVPVEALVREGEETYVLVVNNDKAAKKKVTTGIDDSIKVEILSGLKVGDEYILAGKYDLRAGMPVVLAGKISEPGQGVRP